MEKTLPSGLDNRLLRLRGKSWPWRGVGWGGLGGCSQRPAPVECLEFPPGSVCVRGGGVLACRYAAHCAFRSGKGVKGRDYAKRARRLGDSTEFDAWQRGEYRVRR